MKTSRKIRSCGYFGWIVSRPRRHDRLLKKHGFRLGEKHKIVPKIATQKRQIGGIPGRRAGVICTVEYSLRIAEAGRDLPTAVAVLAG